MIRDLPRLSIRFRQYRMSGCWIERFPYDHEKLDDNLLRYNCSQEMTDFVEYWEKLFYENPQEMPEMVDMFDDLQINP